MSVFQNQIAVVTGASSGIGKSIALGLAAQGANVYILGRNREKLEAVAKKAKKTTNFIKIYEVDITKDKDIQELKSVLQKEIGYLNILIHSAGVISLGDLESTPIEQLDFQYRTNVRAPYLLTQLFLPMLKLKHGQVAFLNSSVGLRSNANMGQYAATKHALKAIVDSLRQEVNEFGVRVLSVYPGRTASPMQEFIFKMEGRKYDEDALMQSSDVAEIVIGALKLSRSAEVTDIEIRPFKKNN